MVDVHWLHAGWSARAMDLTAIIAGIVLLIGNVIQWFLNRGKVKSDVATAIRDELRKDMENLRIRLTIVEEKLDQTEADRDRIQNEFDRYKLDVYRALIERGCAKECIEGVLTI